MVYKSVPNPTRVLMMLRKTLMRCFCVVMQITAVFCQLPSPPIFTLSTNSSSSSSPSSYCPATQRYDVNTFPPRCFDCPRVFPNRMQVARITTTLISTARRPAPKFSPGLPQNQTCGCWTAPANQTFDIVLNASWVVTGFAFSSQRARWLREFDIQASNDNRTFLPWGAFTMTMPLFSSANTSSLVALFTYPVRARYFRVTIRKYANHYVNTSTGFLLTPVQALVSQDQPFGCACPMLSSGACCPFINMTVRNDTCVWCMDPGDIMTRMVDGCGKCKPGTFEHAGRCYQKIPAPPASNSFSVGKPFSDGIRWRVDVNFTLDSRSAVQLFITRKADSPHPCAQEAGSISTCCLRAYHRRDDNSSSSSDEIPYSYNYTPIFWNFTPPGPEEPKTTSSPLSPTPQAVMDCPVSAFANSPRNSIKQFIQFDRGRTEGGGINISSYSMYTLFFTKAEILAWAACDSDAVCTGTMGALFITTTDPAKEHTVMKTITSFLPHLVQQPLRFVLDVPPLVCNTLRSLPGREARAELHYYAATGLYTVRVMGVELQRPGENDDDDSIIQIQWGERGVWIPTKNTPPEFFVSAPPPIIQPPNNSTDSQVLRITDGITTLRIDPPITPVVHEAVARSTHAGILVELSYGFGFSTMPSSGDTDQIVIVTARSTQPARLKRLASVEGRGGAITVYTTTKGFIADTRRVLDLGIACYQNQAALSRWLLQALQLLDTPGLPHADFVRRSCQMVFSGEVAKAFWLVPHRGFTVGRTAPAGVDVIAEFA